MDRSEEGAAILLALLVGKLLRHGVELVVHPPVVASHRASVFGRHEDGFKDTTPQTTRRARAAKPVLRRALVRGGLPLTIKDGQLGEARTDREAVRIGVHLPFARSLGAFGVSATESAPDVCEELEVDFFGNADRVTALIQIDAPRSYGPIDGRRTYA